MMGQAIGGSLPLAVGIYFALGARSEKILAG